MKYKNHKYFHTKNNNKKAYMNKQKIDTIKNKASNPNKTSKDENTLSENTLKLKDTVVGTLKKSRNFGFVVPDNKKLGTDIFVSKKHFMKAKNNQKVP